MGRLTAFEFATAGRVLFGPGRAGELPAFFTERTFVCTGSRPQRHHELIAGLPIYPVTGEPTVELAERVLESARGYRADLIVAIGGGSVIDLGKAVAMLLANGGGPLDYLEVIGKGRPITSASVPFVAVPTTAGTGAEVTANAVLTSVEHKLKASLRSPLMLPRVALVDPLLTVGCPPAVTASSGLDALTQCLEPFVSNRANPVTDGLAREGLRRAAHGLLRAYRDGGDVPARTDLAAASLLGGMALANAKLGAVHGFAGVIGGILDVPHGLACAALLPNVVAANVRALREREPANPALDRYAEIARLLTGRDTADVDDGIAWLRETLDALDVPGLGAYGLTPEHADDIVAKTKRASSTQGNPIVLTDEELHAILASSR